MEPSERTPEYLNWVAQQTLRDYREQYPHRRRMNALARRGARRNQRPGNFGKILSTMFRRCVMSVIDALETVQIGLDTK